MKKFTFVLFVLSFSVLLFSKITNGSAYALKMNTDEEQEQANQIECDEDKKLTEEKITQPKEYLPIPNFCFTEFQCSVNLPGLSFDLYPSHHQIPKRPPKN